MRVLILSQRLPYAPNRGDRVRVYHMMREVAAHAEVDVAALVHDRDEAAHTADLRGIVGEVVTARVSRRRNVLRAATALAGTTPLTHLLLDSPDLRPALASLVARRRPDVVLAFCSSMVRFAFEEPLAGIPCVLDLIDADSAKWRDMAAASRAPMQWIYRREAKLLGRFEVEAMRRSFATLVVNEKERSALCGLDPNAAVQVIENGVHLQSFTPSAPPEPSASVVFCGVMNYQPNVQGALWLAREVWPLVRAARPNARLQLIGATPSPEVLALADDAAGIVVTGTVDDVKPYLWSAALAAAPLQLARGIQNKVLEAIAAGLPCVVTGQVADGLPAEVAPACLVGREPRAFAQAIVGLLDRSPEERRAMAAMARLGPLQWSERLRGLLPLLEGAAAAGRDRDAGEAASVADHASGPRHTRTASELSAGPVNP